ncbi:hypothetical protein [Brevibacillus gelatini]
MVRSIGEDALSLVGAVGGSTKYRPNKEVYFSDFKPSTPLKIPLRTYGGTYNQNIEGKYWDRYNGWTTFMEYAGDYSYIIGFDENLKLQFSHYVNVVGWNMGRIGRAIVRGSYIYLFMSGGGWIKLNKADGALISKSATTVFTFSNNGYAYRDTENLFTFFDSGNKKVVTFDFSTESVVKSFSLPNRNGTPMCDEDRNWYTMIDTYRKTAKYDKDGNLLWQTGDYASFDYATLNGRHNTWHHKKSGYLLTISLWNNRVDLKKWNRDTGALVSSTQLNSNLYDGTNYTYLDNAINKILTNENSQFYAYDLADNGDVIDYTGSQGKRLTLATDVSYVESTGFYDKGRFVYFPSGWYLITCYITLK